MTSGSTYENEYTVTLYLKYRDDFNNKAISDTQNSSGHGENPSMKYMHIYSDDGDLVNACQEIGRYLIEINEHYKCDRHNRYNVCKKEIKTIYFHILRKLENLYKLYKDFNSFITQEKTSSSNCEHPKNCYDFYIEHYKECEGNVYNEFCGELRNFKEVND
ncbi:PIR Superfamily Protein [Plasmodium malariae]|uniref:PIR Superfamily Protein n=1 Tax=Plasmodium malariae TaxID=5858 RepID=A0A1A8X870_PLAMA|nr:PIR Superfamily Protein [Plasmodium malariae]